MNGHWSLWFKLAKQSPEKFGLPAAFCTHMPESKMESFTVTMRGAQPMQIYSWLRQTFNGGSFLSISQSPWSLCICLPSQPVLPKQPGDVFVLWGYALAPARQGDFIKKPMCSCSGEEILSELLSHIGFPSDLMLSSAVTIPRLMPLATSALLRQTAGDRPEVIPPRTKNIAVVGQFCKLRDETASGMEHSVRSARMAVYSLMGVQGHFPKVRRNVLVEKFGKHA
jgi:oleate hydratase